MLRSPAIRQCVHCKVVLVSGQAPCWHLGLRWWLIEELNTAHVVGQHVASTRPSTRSDRVTPVDIRTRDTFQEWSAAQQARESVRRTRDNLAHHVRLPSLRLHFGMV